MKELTDLLEKLAEKLGTTVEHLWGVLLKQTKIVFWEYIAYSVLAVIFLATAIYFIDFTIAGLNSLPESRWTTDKEIGYTVGLVLSIVYSVIAPFILVGNIKQILTMKYNPEYWALNEVLSVLDKE